jgi:hypothetical protein
MDVTINVIGAAEIDPSGQYKCPLCLVQTTASKVDTGWMFCPMLNNQAICLGCCFDYQSIANADDYAAHPFHGDFDQLAHKVNKEVSELRQICMQHQEKLLVAELGRVSERRAERDLNAQLSTIRAKIKSIDDR